MTIRKFKNLLFVVTILSVTGCDPLNIEKAAKRLGTSIDDTTRELMLAVATAAKESNEWRAELDKLANRFSITADVLPLNIGTQGRMFLDFAARRIKDNPAAVNKIVKLIEHKEWKEALEAFQKLQEANPLGRLPEIGQASPSNLPIKWVSHDSFNVDNDYRIIRFNGWDLPLDDSARLKAEIRDKDDKLIRDVSRYIKSSTRYDATMDVSPGSGVQFQPNDRTIVVTFRKRMICQVQITWGARPALPPPPPKITQIILYVGTTWDDKDERITFHYSVVRKSDGHPVSSISVGGKEKWPDPKHPKPDWRHFTIPIPEKERFTEAQRFNYRIHVRYESSDGDPK
jgi:hypothetical protein